jgi:hypothetical protein
MKKKILISTVCLQKLNGNIQLVQVHLHDIFLVMMNLSLVIMHDMHGNVWEWVQDQWHKNYYSAPTDGSSWEIGSFRVVRGGGWYGHAENCRSANRYHYDPSSSYFYLGFRLLRDL